MSDDATALAELNEELARTPIALPVVGQIPFGSAEWNANVAACKGCKYLTYHGGMYCGHDGKLISLHARDATCPTHRQPHVAAGHVAIDERTEKPILPVRSSPLIPMVDHPLYKLFDHVRVISLARRPDRLAAFVAGLPDRWPHPEPRVLVAVDGEINRAPKGWRSGNGAYGCKLSHVAALREALADPVCNSVFIMEDDARAQADYSDQLTSFMADVPSDWKVLWLGGHELAGNRSVKLTASVRTMTCPHRCHAYAIRGREIIQQIVEQMERCDQHIDHCLGKWLADTFTVYAPTKMLIAQGPNKSDIDGKTHTLRNF